MADGAKRVQKHRDKMKAAGLKPVTIWVPDVNAPDSRSRSRARSRSSMPTLTVSVVLEQMLALSDFSDWK